MAKEIAYIPTSFQAPLKSTIFCLFFIFFVFLLYYLQIKQDSFAGNNGFFYFFLSVLYKL